MNLYHYNCLDCTYTLEVHLKQKEWLEKLHLEKVNEFQQAMLYPVLHAITTGVKVDLEERDRQIRYLDEQILHLEGVLKQCFGEVNVNSPKQIKELFLYTLGQKPIYSRSTGKPSFGDEMLHSYAQREVLLKPFVNLILDLRTLMKLKSSFLEASLDENKRMKYSFNIAGDAQSNSAPYSYRLSSGKNIFGQGLNIQTLPSSKSKSIAKASMRGLKNLPNLRKIFVPDEGMMMFDSDLDRADLQVVVWEIEDKILKEAMRRGVDVHLLNDFMLNNKEPPPLDELIETHPRYLDHRTPMKYEREFAKLFCHACVDAEHEFLSPDGWHKVSELNDDSIIMICDIEGNNAHFEKVEGYFSGPSREVIYSQSQFNYNQRVTGDHTVPYRSHKKNLFARRDELPCSTSISFPISCTVKGTVPVYLPILLGKIHCRGTYLPNSEIYLPIDMVPILEQNNIVFDHDTHWRVKIPRPQCFKFPPLDWECLNWSHQDALLYIKERNQKHRKYRDAEILQTLIHLHSHSSTRFDSTVTVSTNKSANQYKKFSKKDSIITGEPVYCPFTSSGYWLTRRKGIISVTGNSDYLGKPRTLAKHLGRTVQEIEKAQKIWFNLHPGLTKWHAKTEHQIKLRGYVENKFGYRWYIQDRIDMNVLPQAVAWIAQSTVGVLINQIWKRIYDTKKIEILIQVHDSLVGQFPIEKEKESLDLIQECSKVIIPYDDPLIIPFGTKTSTISWGDCA